MKINIMLTPFLYVVSSKTFSLSIVVTYKFAFAGISLGIVFAGLPGINIRCLLSPSAIIVKTDSSPGIDLRWNGPFAPAPNILFIVIDCGCELLSNKWTRNSMASESSKVLPLRHPR